MGGLLNFFGGVGSAAADIAKRHDEQQAQLEKERRLLDIADAQKKADWEHETQTHTRDRADHMADVKSANDFTLQRDQNAKQNQIEAESRARSPEAIEAELKKTLLMGAAESSLKTNDVINKAGNSKYLEGLAKINMSNNAADIERTRISSGAYGGNSGKTLADNPYADLINKHAQNNGLDPKLVAAGMAAESSGNPNAVSGEGATGLMQLMDGTAKRFGVKDRTNPDESIRGGSEYLSFLMKRYGGDPKLAYAAYNSGEGTVDKAIKASGKQGAKFEDIVTMLPKETRDYVPKVMSNYTRLQEAEKTGGGKSGKDNGLAREKFDFQTEKYIAEGIDKYFTNQTANNTDFQPVTTREAAYNLAESLVKNEGVSPAKATLIATEAPFNAADGTYQLGRKVYSIPEDSTKMKGLLGDAEELKKKMKERKGMQSNNS